MIDRTTTRQNLRTSILILVLVPLILSCSKGNPGVSTAGAAKAGPAIGSAPFTARWARTVTTDLGSSFFSSIAVDGSGNIYAVGSVKEAGSFDFGGVTAMGEESADIPVLVKYDSSGKALWVKKVSGRNESEFDQLTTDDSGNVYIAGAISGTSIYDFGNGVIAAGSSPGSNAIIVKYDSSGTTQWAKTTRAGTHDSNFKSVAADRSGNVYAAGMVYGAQSHDFEGPTVAPGCPGPNVVLVKYGPSGKALWARTVVKGILTSEFFFVTVDGSGNVYAAGYIMGTLGYDFGGATAAGANPEGQNALLVKYNPSGRPLWAQSVSKGAGYSFFGSIRTAGSDSVYAAGALSGSGEYGFGGIITSGSAENGYSSVLVKYSYTGKPLWAKPIKGGASSSELNALVVDSYGNVCAAGSIWGTGSFDFGDNVTTGGTFAEGNMVLVTYGASGAALSAQSEAEGSGPSNFTALAMDRDGNAYAAGYISGMENYTFGSVTAAGTSVGGSAVIVCFSIR
jgi:hypothetical protein